MSETSSKGCVKCGESKSTSEFHRNSARRDGLTNICKQCACERTREWAAANPERVRDGWEKWASSEAGRRSHREAQRRYLQTENGTVSNRNKVRRSTIKSQYGISVEEYMALMSRGCAICGTHDGQMNLDHDHSTGKVRDALCGPCNRGLGQFRDKADHLLRAVAYLEVHSAGESSIPTSHRSL